MNRTMTRFPRSPVQWWRVCPDCGLPLRRERAPGGTGRFPLHWREGSEEDFGALEPCPGSGSQWPAA